ncbi:MAG: cytochrome c [Proteobacteria bacterium]|nr:cytochrome c [Pseudomonadota bacterium]
MRFAALAVVTLAFACNKGQEPPAPTSGRPNAERESGPGNWAPVAGGSAVPATPPAADPAKKAQSMYAMVCQMCHGETGRGDGTMAKNLPVKPRDYADAAWQASVTDDDLRKAILLGGAGIGKSPLMPGQPQLKDQPDVLNGLVAIIRGFKQ